MVKALRQLGPAIGLILLVASPPPATASPVVASAVSSWTFDSITQRYTYTYVVSNAANSPNYLRTFAVRPVARPISTVAPTGWTAYRGWQHDSTSVVWTVTNFGPQPPNWKFQPYVGPHHIAPGASLGGFQIISDKPPDSAAVIFSAQGFDTIPGGAHSNGPRPPALKTIWEEGWTGSAIGPIDISLVGVSPGPRPNEIQFYAPVPNPTRGGVDLAFMLPKEGRVEIDLYDVAGRRLAVVTKERKPAGRNVVPWDGTDSAGRRLSPGVYFYQLLFEERPVGQRRVVVIP